MAVDKIITRADAHALEADQQIVNDIIQGVVTGSSILPLMTRLPNMTGKQAKLPVLNSLPEAYWVTGDNGLKQTTSMMWKNKFIYAEEIAVVVPIPEAVLDDSDYDIWGETKPRIIEQFYKKIDRAIILGDDKPIQWREGLIPSIINVGGNIAPESKNLYNQISDAMGVVEESGYDVTGLLGSPTLKKQFRNGLLDTTGQPLSNSEVTDLKRIFARNGAWDNKKAKFIVGDFSQAVYSIRQDIQFKLFDSGVVSDSDGRIIYNLLQNDMVALRVTMRLGWEIPNPINALNENNGTRFPFALVENAEAPTTYKVEFVVTSTTTKAAITDAEVTLAGQTKKTNSEGKASFTTFGNTKYEYTIFKDKILKSDTVEVATEDKTIAISVA